MQACLQKLEVCVGEGFPGPPAGHVLRNGDVVARLAVLMFHRDVAVCDEGPVSLTGLEQSQRVQDLPLTEATWP